MMKRIFILVLLLPLCVRAADGTISRRKAFIMSLAIPGSGEFYCGARKTGITLLSVEAGLWLTAFGFSSYRNWAREDLRGFASVHAGVDGNAVGDDEEFYMNIADWESMAEYNRYTELGNGTPLYSNRSGYGWNWDSAGNRNEYRHLRGSMILAERRLNITLSAIAVNHLLSAINTLRLSRPGAAPPVRNASLYSGYHAGHGCLMLNGTAAF